MKKIITLVVFTISISFVQNAHAQLEELLKGFGAMNGSSQLEESKPAQVDPRVAPRQAAPSQAYYPQQQGYYGPAYPQPQRYYPQVRNSAPNYPPAQNPLAQNPLLAKIVENVDVADLVVAVGKVLDLKERREADKSDNEFRNNMIRRLVEEIKAETIVELKKELRAELKAELKAELREELQTEPQTRFLKH